MFVPLEPKLVQGVADIDVQVRYDLACGAYPRGMHSIEVVCNGLQEATTVTPATVAGRALEGSFVACPDHSVVTQIDAALQRVPTPIEATSGLIVGDDPAMANLRFDVANLAIAKPHFRDPSPRKPLGEPSIRGNTRSTRWKLDSPGPISHSGAPLDSTDVAVDPLNRTPADKFTTYRAYSPTAAGTSATAMNWSQGLVESSRRRDWIWPKMVDELIGRQWAAINQLGRTALGNSREETRRILVTSCKAGEGRTTIALALARWGALTGQRTLLVDADLVRPGVTKALHIDSTGDWRKTSLAFGVENSLITCRSLPLSLLPLNPQFEPPAVQAIIEQLIVQLAVAEQEFDCCIIDAGSIAELTEQIATVTRLSSSIVVVNSHAEGVSPVLIGACNSLWQCGKPAIAIADNFRR